MLFRSELLKPIEHLDISIFVDDRPKKQENLSPINILVLQEPNEYFGHHEWAIQNKNLFSFINCSASSQLSPPNIFPKSNGNAAK